MSPLIYINQSDQVDYQRSLATSIVPSDNDQVYTVTLGNKYRWSNGKPVTADDVVFTWNIMKAASGTNPSLPWGYGGEGIGGVPSIWSHVAAKNAHTVVITLTKPTDPTWFIHNGLAQIMPAPSSVWNKYPHNMIRELKYIQSLANSPKNAAYHVVDGPYALKSMEPNASWVFVPNASFGGHKSSLSQVILQYETSPF